MTEGELKTMINLFYKQKNEENSNTSNTDNNQSKIFEQLKKLQTKVDTHDAKITAQSELRQVTEEKINRLQEKIGEIRELYQVLTIEKQDLDKEIGIIKKMIETAKPLELYKQISKTQNQQSILEGKQEIILKKQESFKRTFDDFSHKLKVFSGAEQLLKIQEETKKDLFEIKKINIKISSHAEKLENQFIGIKSKVEHVDTQIGELQSLSEELQKIKKDLQILLESPTLDKKELEELKIAHEQLTDLVIQTFTKLKEKHKFLSQQVQQNHEQNLGNITKVYHYQQKQITYMLSSMENISKKADSFDTETIRKLKKLVLYYLKSNPPNTKPLNLKTQK
jgi:chromosome segregation ATPase